MHDMPWDHGLRVTDGAPGLVGHAGGIILREAADRTVLTAELAGALAVDGRFPEIDRGEVMVSAAVMIALGGRSMSGAAVLQHLSLVLGEPGDLADPAPHPRPRRHRHPGQDRAGQGEGPRSRLGADRGPGIRVPLACDRRPGPGRPGRHRHRRDPDQFQLAEGRSLGTY